MKKELIAIVAHTINAAYCLSLGDNTQVAWEDAEEWQKNSALAGVDMHLENPDATPEQSHDSWLAAKLEDGWAFGEVKDVEAKLHPCMLPYEELPQAQKSKDYLFRAVVHALKDIPDTEIVKEVVQVFVPSEGATNIQAGYVGVKYIGRRPEWVDRLYQTGLVFNTDQVRALPPDVAQKLLRHIDLFERSEGEIEQPETPASNKTDDDTQKLMDEAAKQQREKSKDQTQIQDVLDQINQMPKSALLEFANNKYGQKLSDRDTVAVLRGKVIGFVDQFGAV